MLDPEDVRRRHNSDLASDPWTEGRYVVAEAVWEPEPFTGETRLMLPVLGRQSGLPATWLPCDPDGTEVGVAIFADSLQQLIEEDHAPWPRCPEHDHSLHAHAIGGRAFWRCDENESIRYGIGCLPRQADA
jgi:hypothetical protein